ncbi:MAG: FtsB family cell division protein [Sphingomonadaceae bacterium]
MARRKPKVIHRKEKVFDLAALGLLLLLGGLAIIGPAGFFAWSEALAARDARETRIKQLEREISLLSNRVELLDPDHADPDMVGELLRSNLNVVHPDEVVLTLQPDTGPETR